MICQIRYEIVYGVFVKDLKAPTVIQGIISSAAAAEMMSPGEKPKICDLDPDGSQRGIISSETAGNPGWIIQIVYPGERNVMRGSTARDTTNAAKFQQLLHLPRRNQSFVFALESFCAMHEHVAAFVEEYTLAAGLSCATAREPVLKKPRAAMTLIQFREKGGYVQNRMGRPYFERKITMFSSVPALQLA